MLDIRNHTPLTAEVIPGLDKSGYDYATLIIKGNFILDPSRTDLALSEEPAKLIKADKHYDEPENSSVQYEADTAILKLGTDVVINGHAYAPQNQMQSVVDVGLQINNTAINYKVFGDRQWVKEGSVWRVTAAKQFDRLALNYENSFGGVCAAPTDDELVEYSEFNPIGKGFVGNKKSPVEGMLLPNIENPNALISSYKDKPTPAGFGFISRAWQPRLQLAGTYDENWEASRQPLLPVDFNEKFFNGAHPNCITPEPLVGGEQINLKNMSQLGDLHFVLPKWTIPVTVTVKGRSKSIYPVLDTIVIEPDINKVALTWRVTMPCYKQFLYINKIVIGRKT
ncbi:hypothetical protein MNBD_GAMMA08-2638 [hydrothermal vent metagenome]|uniref:DUF2169 domain-containing protein n=1 Tax=hydrothermal vent metagenome TaxID=652676 RepID=A0A3B0X9M1_9ZZZZ